MSDPSQAQSRKVSALKGHLTRTINQIRDAMRRGDDEATMITLRDSLCDKRDVFSDELYTLIEELIADNKISTADRKEQELKEIDQVIDKVNEDIERYLLKKNQVKDATPDGPAAHVNEYQLEKMTVPKFSGKDYFRWRSIYDEMVHSQPIKDSIKFLRLYSCLESEPKELLKNFPPNDASYVLALDRLESVYGGESRRVSQTIQMIRNGKVIDGEDLILLRRFISMLQGATVALKSTSENETLLHLAKERLSRDLLRKYVQWSLDQKVSQSFTSLVDFLNEWCQVVEAAPDMNANKSNKSRPALSMHAQVISNNNNRGSGQSKSQFTQKCLWHQKEKNKVENHYLDACTDFKALTVNDRRDFVFKSRLCRLCLKPNHLAKDCRNLRAQCKKCSGDNKHHFLLHQNVISEVTHSQQSSPEVQVGLIESNNCQVQKQVTSLQTIPLRIRHNNRHMLINAILDAGSNTSFISKEVVDALEIPTFDEEQKRMNTMNKSNELISVSKVRLNIESVNGRWSRDETLMVTSKMLLNSRPVLWHDEKCEWPHLKNIQFPELAKRPHHEMLIGADLAHYHRSYREVRGPIGSPVARLGPLGWSAFGRIRPDTVDDEISLDIKFCEIEGNLEREVRKMWELENLGVEQSLRDVRRLSANEFQAEQMLKGKMEFNGDRYVAPILWSKDAASLSSNFEAVLKRTQSMESKLKRNPDTWIKVTDVINEYKDKGYVCEGNDNDKKESFFLPYFPIIRESRETTKCRLVFDCSAKYDGKSLNDQILVGPKLQNDIIDILIRFRRFKVAILADVSQMYLQIELAKDDQRYCKFIFNDKVYKWTRTIFGRADSPYIALQVIKAHAEKYRNECPEVVDSIQMSSYIDDFCESCTNESQAISLQNKVTKIFSDAGMTIKKWNSNAKTVLDQIPEDLRASSVSQVSQDTLAMTKILGLRWDVDEDQLLYDIEVKTSDVQESYTKRQVLRIIARMYDPLCLLNPFINRAKVIFQKIWVSGVSWDDPIPPDLNLEFRQWCDQIQKLKEIAVPRWLGLAGKDKFSIHVFSDASKDIYASLAYVRFQNDEGISARLVLAKSKVTPLKARSIPNLELMAATLALRLAFKVSAVLDYDIRKVTFWVDAVDVLYQIRKPAKYQKPFVANRVGEIQTITDMTQWRYCPTKLNVADIPTRCRSVDELKNEVTYWNGPDFLVLDEQCWPKDVMIEASKVNEDHDDTIVTQVLVTVITDDDFPLHPSRWSSFYRLVKRLSYVYRFIKNCKVHLNERILSSKLQPDEWQRSKNVLIGICQRESFNEEISLLKQGKRLQRNSKLLKLDPFLDADGLMRSKSRLQAVKWLSEEFKFPIILPKDHPTTRLLVTELHQSLGHPLGVNAALNELNKKYWVIGARVLMKKVKSACMKCKIQNAKPVQPIMGPIPNFRLAEPLQPFSSIGIDFCGPYLTKRGRGAARNKRYMAMFTCLKIRAVHIEMVFDLTTESFLHAFSRMADRRGWPLEVLTDNGRTFVKAADELKTACLVDPVKIEAKARRPIKWRFNAPYAAHSGGVFEVMIKGCKRALEKVLCSADVNDEELQTAFCQVEALMNSRPLSAPSDSINDDEPLTPNHFLVGRIDPVSVFQDPEESEVTPTRRWKYVRTLTSHYWSRWQAEILHGMRSRTKWFQEKENIKVGDVVLVLEPITFKRTWRLGRVAEVFEGSDGRVRTVSVMVNGKVYKRPVNKLCPLEC